MKNKMISLKDKKAISIPIVILVFFVLFTTSASLFIFQTKTPDASFRIADTGIMNLVQEKKDIAEFYISDAIEYSSIETYEDFLKSQKYIEKPYDYKEDNVVFSNLNEDLNEEFVKDFNKNFKEKFNQYEFEENYLRGLKEKIGKGKFSSSYEKGKIVLEVPYVEIKQTSNEIDVNYYPNISIEKDFKKLGLESFFDIEKTKEDCLESQNFENCLRENLSEFNIEVEEKKDPGEYFIVEIESKKEFFIDEEFRKIHLSFVVNKVN